MVAASAGVSVATVSKVLNGRSDVAESTRTLVQEKLQQHNYVLSATSRAESGTRAIVEVQVEAALVAYSSEIVQGVIDAGSQLGIDIVVSTRVGAAANLTSERPAAWARALALTGRRAVIGVTSELTEERLAAMSRARVPYVVVDPLGMPLARLTSVGSTNFAGGLTATQHLLSLGHRRIGYLGGPKTAACNHAREHGFRAAMEGAGLDLLPEYVTTGAFSYETGVNTGGSMLDQAEPPTAIFAGSDEVALGVIEAARIRGLNVPRDLSIVGFDDTQLAHMAAPPLTTVRQPLREMGAVALRTALRLAAGETIESHHVELATSLIVRGSTAPPRSTSGRGRSSRSR
ncbi:transcriptional regulator, LacI family [Nakamurella panacisegetis]|uniref:Transcriptional regulator, LacI family n=1 Tax=Nakamurella panacisegetis TaxID=1090615 RepID=A0A1H0M138_9ACTN|nr:transcriptional regulator, LacI family [Nakamurella panacisegetis]